MMLLLVILLSGQLGANTILHVEQNVNTSMYFLLSSSCFMGADSDLIFRSGRRSVSGSRPFLLLTIRQNQRAEWNSSILWFCFDFLVCVDALLDETDSCIPIG